MYACGTVTKVEHASTPAHGAHSSTWCFVDVPLATHQMLTSVVDLTNSPPATTGMPGPGATLTGARSSATRIASSQPDSKEMFGCMIDAGAHTWPAGGENAGDAQPGCSALALYVSPLKRWFWRGAVKAERKRGDALPPQRAISSRM